MSEKGLGWECRMGRGGEGERKKHETNKLGKCPPRVHLHLNGGQYFLSPPFTDRGTDRLKLMVLFSL